MRIRQRGFRSRAGTQRQDILKDGGDQREPGKLSAGGPPRPNGFVSVAERAVKSAERSDDLCNPCRVEDFGLLRPRVARFALTLGCWVEPRWGSRYRRSEMVCNVLSLRYLTSEIGRSRNPGGALRADPGLLKCDSDSPRWVRMRMIASRLGSIPARDTRYPRLRLLPLLIKNQDIKCLRTRQQAEIRPHRGGRRPGASGAQRPSGSRQGRTSRRPGAL